MSCRSTLQVSAEPQVQEELWSTEKSCGPQTEQLSQRGGMYVAQQRRQRKLHNQPPSPTESSTVVGPCVADGLCIQSPNYPSNYGAYESCTVYFSNPGTLSADSFSTEKGFDVLNLDGTSFTGLSGPAEMEMHTTSVLTWTSDWGTELWMEALHRCCRCSQGARVRCWRSTREHDHR